MNLLNVFAISLLLAFSARAATIPIIQVGNEEHRLNAISNTRLAQLSNGDQVALNSPEIQIILEGSSQYKASEIKATIKDLGMVPENADYSTFTYSFKIRFSEECQPFCILSRSSMYSDSKHIPFHIDTSETDDDGFIEVAINPHPERSKINVLDYLYECRIFENGKEILSSSQSTSSTLIKREKLFPRTDQVPEAIITVLPWYAQSAPKGAETENATIEFVITEDGYTTKAKVKSKTDRKFGLAAKRAIELTRYYPGFKDGEPINLRVRQKLLAVPTYERIRDRPEEE